MVIYAGVGDSKASRWLPKISHPVVCRLTNFWAVPSWGYWRMASYRETYLTQWEASSVLCVLKECSVIERLCFMEKQFCNVDSCCSGFGRSCVNTRKKEARSLCPPKRKNTMGRFGIDNWEKNERRRLGNDIINLSFSIFNKPTGRQWSVTSSGFSLPSSIF